MILSQNFKGKFMQGLERTNTSINMKYPLLLLPFDSAPAFIADNFTVPHSRSGEQLNLSSPSFDNPFYSENREITSSGEDFLVDDYLQQAVAFSGEEVLCDFINELTKEFISMEPEMLKVINEKFWDLF
jgi:hypothetical protein